MSKSNIKVNVQLKGSTKYEVPHKLSTIPLTDKKIKKLRINHLSEKLLFLINRAIRYHLVEMPILAFPPNTDLHNNHLEG